MIEEQFHEKFIQKFSSILDDVIGLKKDKV